jgi:hypothetical protein
VSTDLLDVDSTPENPRLVMLACIVHGSELIIQNPCWAFW